MNFLKFNSTYYEILNTKTSYLNFLKFRSIESFFFDKEKKDLSLKVYNAQSLKKKDFKPITLNSQFAFKSNIRLKSNHLEFLNNMHKTQIFKKASLGKYESVKHLNYNGRYNLILGFHNFKGLKTK